MNKSKDNRLDETFFEYDAFLGANDWPTSADQAYRAFSAMLKLVEERNGHKYQPDADTRGEAIYFHEFRYDDGNPYWLKIEDIHVFRSYKHVVALDNVGNLCFYNRKHRSPSGLDTRLSIGAKIREFSKGSSKVGELSGLDVRDELVFTSPHRHHRLCCNNDERTTAYLTLSDERSLYIQRAHDQNRRHERLPFNIKYIDNYGIEIEFHENIPPDYRLYIILLFKSITNTL